MERRKTMRNTVIAAAVFSSIIMAAAAPAHSLGRALLPGEVNIEVVSDRGNIFQAIPHQDFRQSSTRIIKRYLEAKKGENYGIVITNSTPERVGVVIGVDGRNIITGKRSELRNNEAMYIVNAYESVRCDGWRTGNDQVHRFYFTDEADSYSVKTFGDSSAMGVIAVAVYREQPRPQQLLEQKSEGLAAPAAPSSKKNTQSTDLFGLARESAGTGFGEARYSPVITVQFKPERDPVQKTLVKYEWRQVLCRKGILSCGRELGNRLWDEDGYAPYPPGYPGN
jgi:hypothetical protein